MYQPKTGQQCNCKRGLERDNCPSCEGTGMVIDFAAIRAKNAEPALGKITKKMLDCLDGDGHTIIDPDYYTEAGWPAEFIAKLTRIHESDGSPKGSLNVDGVPVEALAGVYSLDFHQAVQQEVGAADSEKRGRGFRARELAANIRATLNEPVTP